ncbi:MAG: prolyl oligopeptidase family serine peptidase [Clostridia bacterium]|nr:prolyl oligopeptidase family serine peptidase [Clostridia bacterium]
MNFKFYPADEKCYMNYGVYYPDNYADLPLMIYLHGAGERGLKYDHIQRHAISKLIAEGREYNAVVLAPQCPEDCVWDNVVKDLKKIIDKVAAEYDIKPDRICITGNSMGGYGTFAMGMAYPNFFSAMAPISGGGMPWRYTNLKTTPIYAAHGDMDDLVPIACTKMVVDSVNAHGGSAKLLVAEGYGHNDGIDYAYRSTEIIDWLLAQRRTTDEIAYEFCRECF